MRNLRRHALSALQLALLAGVIVLALVYGESVVRLRDELERWGAWGAAGFVLLQAAWMLTTVPSAPLMMLGGVVYGVWLGTLYVLIGGVIGSAATFLIGRHVWRARARHGARHRQAVEHVIRMVDDHPITSIVIVRLAPVFPFSLLNYGFGATHMSFRLYLVISSLVLLPGAAMYAGLGNVLQRAALGERLPLAELLIVIAFAAIGVALTVYARRRARASRLHGRQQPNS